MALDDDDMTTPPEEPDSGTPADRAAGSISEDEYLGRTAAPTAVPTAGDGGATAGGRRCRRGAGEDDPTTETEEDSRFA